MRSEGLWESLSKGFRSRYWANVGARAKMGRRGRGSGEEKINSLFNQHYHTAPITSCVRGRKHFQNRGVSGKRSFSPLLQSSFISIFRSCSNFLDEPTLKRLLCRLKQKKKKKDWYKYKWHTSKNWKYCSFETLLRKNFQVRNLGERRSTNIISPEKN